MTIRRINKRSRIGIDDNVRKEIKYETKKRGEL